MKNVKKILVLAAVLSVLMCVSVFAAGGTIDTVTAETGSGASFENYAGQVKFDMTYETDTEGMFLVLVVKEGVNTNGGKIAPRAEDILYVNQATSSNGEVSFTGDDAIYPSGIEDGSKIYLAGAGLDELTLMGTIETPEPVAPDLDVSFVGTNNVATWQISDDAKTLNVVNNAVACVVGYTADGGDTYTKLVGVESGTAGYDFDLSTVPANAQIVIAVKGDMSGDGRIRSGDATQVLKAAGGTAITALQKLVGDLDANGKIRSGEATQVLKAAGGVALPW